jgi:hypothetical protein
MKIFLEILKGMVASKCALVIRDVVYEQAPILGKTVCSKRIFRNFGGVGVHATYIASE